jgi:hypothetical protein
VKERRGLSAGRAPGWDYRTTSQEITMSLEHGFDIAQPAPASRRPMEEAMTKSSRPLGTRKSADAARSRNKAADAPPPPMPPTDKSAPALLAHYRAVSRWIEDDLHEHLHGEDIIDNNAHFLDEAFDAIEDVPCLSAADALAKLQLLKDYDDVQGPCGDDVKRPIIDQVADFLDGILLNGEADETPADHLDVTSRWFAVRSKWEAALAHFEGIQREALGGSQDGPPAALKILREAFRPLLSYTPVTALEWAEKVAACYSPMYSYGEGIPAVLWADAERLGIGHADRDVMEAGGAPAEVVAAYHTREGLRSQFSAHPDGSEADARVQKVWRECTTAILEAKDSSPSTMFTRLRVILDPELGLIDGEQDVAREALVPVLAATAALHMGQPSERLSPAEFVSARKSAL